MDVNQLVVSQVTLGAVSSWVLQALKKASWFPVLNESSTTMLKYFWAAVTSLLAITGLSYVYDPAAHTLLIQNFSLTLVLNAAWHWLTQFVMQEGWYQAVFNKVEPTEAQAVAQAK